MGATLENVDALLLAAAFPQANWLPNCAKVQPDFCGKGGQALGSTPRVRFVMGKNRKALNLSSCWLNIHAYDHSGGF